MNIYQFIHGILFYIILSSYFAVIKPEYTNKLFLPIFVLLNCFQCIVHFILYVKKYREIQNLHYFIEILFYLLYLLIYRTPAMCFFTIQTVLFVVTTIKKRKN
ncbi:hypothetical protein NUSPORA_02304 [Nucleospora cyclopteri]